MGNKEVILTSRHWALYTFLKKYRGIWVTQQFIYDKLIDFYKEYGVNENNFHDSFARQKIARDIVDLNNSEKIHKIILSSSKGIKIASRSEYRHWSDLRWHSIGRMAKRLLVKDNKYKNDGQVRLILEEGSKAREYFETFFKSVDNNDEKE